MRVRERARASTVHGDLDVRWCRASFLSLGLSVSTCVHVAVVKM